MTKLTKTGLTIIAAFAVASCSVGSDPCGTGYVEKLGGCQKVTSTGGKTSKAIKDADVDALADDAQTETITGLDDSCSGQSDCAGKDANYCALDPMSGVGVCTLKDCTTDPDNCPPEHRCCALPEYTNYPPICFPPDLYNQIAALGYCPK